MGLWRLGHAMVICVYLGSIVFWRIVSMLRRLIESKRGPYSESFLDKEGEIEDDLEGLVLGWAQESAIVSATLNGVSSETQEDQETVAEATGGEQCCQGPMLFIPESNSECEKLLDPEQPLIHDCSNLDLVAGNDQKCGSEDSLGCCETVKFAACGEQTVAEDRTANAEDYSTPGHEDTDEGRAANAENPEGFVEDTHEDRAATPEGFVEDTNEDRAANVECLKPSVEDTDEDRVANAENLNVSVEDINENRDANAEKPKGDTNGNGVANAENPKVCVEDTNEDRAANAEDARASGEDTTVGNEDTVDPDGNILDSEPDDHDFYIQELKAEIKKLRGSNLSIIPEECESEYSVESNTSIERDADCKKSIGCGNNLDSRLSSIRSIAQINCEILTFYEKYTERMRCYDILNYQQMYTIGFHQSSQTQKSKFKRLTSTLQKYTLNKSEVLDDSEEMMRRLEHDLETVYVAQTCLSWEALHWQYGKFKEAMTLFSDSEHPAMFYDHVADQFQQFQVLLQRFMENEQFEGPRVQNYVKTRCVLRNILQVPAVKVMMTEEERLATGSTTVTPGQLVRIMEGTIMTFWDFVRTDKEKSSIPKLVFNVLWRHHEELEDPKDSKFLHIIRTCLQQKKLKVRDLHKKGKCIIKRVDLTTGEGLEILMALVDIKIVSRVLKMSRITTDHLQWCQKKLNKMNVSEGKVHRELCTALFPS